MRISDWSSDVCSSDLVTQCVTQTGSDAFAAMEALRSEYVVSVTGKVVARTAETLNPNLPTGGVEVVVSSIEVLGEAQDLPMPVFGEQEYPEDIRLKYRFLDLRRERLHNNIILRSKVIRSEEHTSELQSLMRISYAVF